MFAEEKKQKIETLRWILNTRWFTVTLFLIFSEIILRFIFRIQLDVPILLRIGAPIVFYASAFWFLWLLRDHLRVSATTVAVINNMIVPIDLIIFTVILYFAGGIGSYIVNFYFFAILIAIALHGPRGIFFTATAASFLVITEYFLEKSGTLPPSPAKQTLTNFLKPNVDVEIGYLAVFVANMYIAAILASFISSGFQQVLRTLTLERNKISSILNVIPDGVLITDSDGRLIFINASMEKVTGVTQDDVYGKILIEALLKKEPRLEKLYKIIRQKIPPFEKQELRLEVPYEKIFQLTRLPLRESNKFSGEVRIIHDVSREKTISRLKSEFISIAAHQLRTPLSAIKWTFRMILDGDIGKVTNEQKTFLERGFYTNERMIKLVSDLLNVSRIEEGRFGYEFVVFPVEKIISDLLQDYEPRFREKHIRYSLRKSTESLPVIKIDPQRLRLALQNVIDNAINYTLPAGEVTITLEQKDEFLTVKIKDTGVGIPRAQMERLFSKFFRGENVMRMQTEGSGLGLYIVKNIMKRHGGDVLIESEEGVGTTVTLTLPVDEKMIPEVETVFGE